MALIWLFSVALALSLVQAGCAMGQAAPTECSAGPLADGLKPSRGGFMREILFAPGTARTPRFDDYTPDSYHVDKLDLATALPVAARECGLTLQALVVLGPTGPLWAYHVAAFFTDRGSLHLNTVVMPHARITGKATATVAMRDLAALFAAIETAPILASGRPSASGPAPSADFSYDFLAVRYSPTGPSYWYGSLDAASDTTHVTKLVAAINRLLDRTVPTYEHLK